MTNDTREQERALEQMLEQMGREDPVRARERRMLLIIGVLVLALVATVGIAILLKAPKEREIAQKRCETEQSATMAWKEMDALKASNPGMSPREMQDRVDAKRSAFRDASRAACAAK